MASGRRRSTQNNNKKIGSAEIKLLRDKGADAIRYYETFGLLEVRNRAVNLVLTGFVSLVGLVVFDWGPITMLAFLVADALITVIADCIRYPLSRQWLAESHATDHSSGHILLISDGLEDGSGCYADTGSGFPPGAILAMSICCSLFMVPVIGAALESTGVSPMLAAINEPTFKWFVGLDFAWRIISTIFAVLAVRRHPPGKAFLFMESGNVVVLYASLLLLVWFPLAFGEFGLYLLFFVVYLVRIGFGIFAYIWTPRAVKVLQRRVANHDYALRPKNSTEEGTLR